MGTAARRARKKANKLKGWPKIPGDFAEVGPPTSEEQELPPAEPVATTTESEHAAAMAALAKAKRMRNRQAGE